MALRKRSFTLLELMLVMLLLLLALGGLGFYIPKALQKEAFEKSVTHLIGRIALAQEIMLDYHIDVEIQLEQMKEGLDVKIVPKGMLTKKQMQALNQKSLVQGILEFSFHRQERLLFEGKTGKTPQGTFQIRDAKNKASLCLKGYPFRICRGEYKEHEIQTPYPEEILSAL